MATGPLSVCGRLLNSHQMWGCIQKVFNQQQRAGQTPPFAAGVVLPFTVRTLRVGLLMGPLAHVCGVLIMHDWFLEWVQQDETVNI